jgi:hypothetical protein
VDNEKKLSAKLVYSSAYTYALAKILKYGNVDSWDDSV